MAGVRVIGLLYIVYSFLSQIYVAMLHPLIYLLSSLNPNFNTPLPLF